MRKTVTVLFADVGGPTALGERLDPESFRRVMARYFEVARACLERHGGTVEKFIGDAVMAAFGVPVLHEDDALRALRAAVELRAELASINVELERTYGISLRLRTGVNTGEVVSGTKERLVTGDAVNVAARLEQAAEPDDILIGKSTQALARGAIEAERVDGLVVKGKTEPLTAYRLLSLVEGAPAFERRLDAPLVGRREELARVRAAFDEAVSTRSCRLVTVLGPPGIGKSRLASEVSAALAGDAAVLTAAACPTERASRTWPLVEIFREAGAERELEAALSVDAPEDVFWSVRKALEQRARERPLALVMEDIHWAEPTLLDLAEHLADWTRDAPLLLLCLARPELLDGRPAWGGEVMTLQPLSEYEAEELIENLVAGAPLDGSTRSRIREVAEGNPLFVEQLLAMLAEGGSAGDVPPTIHALLAARLDGLPEQERDVLERASVIGHDFEWEALGELSPDRRRPPGAQLAALVRNELIRPHAAIPDTFSFHHALIRDAAYTRLPKERRSDLHERCADWLSGRGDEFEEMIGYHLEQANRWVVELGPPDERAISLAARAAASLSASGKRAYARGDGPAAANLLERAIALLTRDDPVRLRLMPLLGRAHRDAANMERAEAVLTEALDRARALDEPVVAADAGLALVDLRFHATTATRQEVLAEVDSATRVYAEHGDEAGLGRALALGGKLRFWAGETAAALEDLERAAEHARNAGDRYQEADCIQYMLAAIVYGPTPAAEGLAFLEAMGTRLEGNRRLDMSLLNSQGRLEAMEGRFESARAALARAATLADGVLEVERYSMSWSRPRRRAARRGRGGGGAKRAHRLRSARRDRRARLPRERRTHAARGAVPAGSRRRGAPPVGALEPRPSDGARRRGRPGGLEIGPCEAARSSRQRGRGRGARPRGRGARRRDGLPRLARRGARGARRSAAHRGATRRRHAGIRPGPLPVRGEGQHCRRHRDSESALPGARARLTRCDPGWCGSGRVGGHSPSEKERSNEARDRPAEHDVARTERSLMLDWARLADEAGFDVLGTIYKPNYDSWEPLATLAGV